MFYPSNDMTMMSGVEQIAEEVEDPMLKFRECLQQAKTLRKSVPVIKEAELRDDNSFVLPKTREDNLFGDVWALAAKRRVMLFKVIEYLKKAFSYLLKREKMQSVHRQESLLDRQEVAE
jgi:hypothetical protein